MKHMNRDPSHVPDRKSHVTDRKNNGGTVSFTVKMAVQHVLQRKSTSAGSRELLVSY